MVVVDAGFGGHMGLYFKVRLFNETSVSDITCIYVMFKLGTLTESTAIKTRTSTQCEE